MDLLKGVHYAPARPVKATGRGSRLRGRSSRWALEVGDNYWYPLEENMASQSNQGAESSKANLPSKFIFILAGVFVIICGLVALLVFYRFARLSSGPKTQIILEPDYSLVSTVDPADLEIDAEILTARANAL